MKQTYFVTGYPGFLADNLIQQLIHDHHQDLGHIYLLVSPPQMDQAAKEVNKLKNKVKSRSDLFTIITGDITRPDLSIHPENNQLLQDTVTHVFHLAAIYDLAVPKDIAWEVNVNGTNKVNDWVKKVNKLQRYIYFSTAYVSGKREGRIYEQELAVGQTFRNYYEHTKYEAECSVVELMESVPTTIIRPGVVKGNSVTGKTIKFDGLYFMLNLLERLRFFPIIPYFGEGGAAGNFVPSDYVLKATSYLAIAEVGEGKTYHLTDPSPYTMRELQQILSEAYLGKSPKGSLPIGLAKRLLSSPAVRKWLQVEKEALDYFTIHASYDNSQVITDLSGTNIVCPDLKDTVPSMIDFYRKYKHDKQMHIMIS